MAQIIDGQEVSRKIKDRVRAEVEKLRSEYNTSPSLHVILVGEDPASQVYVNMKRKACEALGMISKIYNLPADMKEQDLGMIVKELDDQRDVNGILVQLPLPKSIDKHSLIDLISTNKDVDGLTASNAAKLYRGEDCLEPCTPKGVIALLEHYNIPIEGKDVAIIGRSDIVGKPLSVMMSGTKRNATVTLCHSKTKDLESYTKEADIVIAAVGKPEYIRADAIKEGAVVIDIGVNRVDDPSSKNGYRLVGDVDFESVAKKAGYITPVPGGVGPMTIACLMENTIKAYRLQKGLR